MAILKKMTMLTYAFSFKVFLYEHKEIPNFEMDDDTKSTPRGFEPLRAEPTGFQVQHLNHSVTVSVQELLDAWLIIACFFASMTNGCFVRMRNEQRNTDTEGIQTPAG